MNRERTGKFDAEYGMFNIGNCLLYLVILLTYIPSTLGHGRIVQLSGNIFDCPNNTVAIGH